MKYIKLTSFFLTKISKRLYNVMQHPFILNAPNIQIIDVDYYYKIIIL